MAECLVCAAPVCSIHLRHDDEHLALPPIDYDAGAAFRQGKVEGLVLAGSSAGSCGGCALFLVLGAIGLVFVQRGRSRNDTEPLSQR
jgi:hypothetical protein